MCNKKKIFTLNYFVGLFILTIIFLYSKTASAEINILPVPKVGGSFQCINPGSGACFGGNTWSATIPTHNQNSILLCDTMGDNTNGSWSSGLLTVGNATTTNFLNDGARVFHYLVDPPTGIVEFHSSHFYRGDDLVNCVILENIDTQNPVKYYTQQHYWNLVSSTYNIAKNKNMVMAFFTTNLVDTYTSPDSIILWQKSYSYNTQIWAYNVATADNQNITFSWSPVPYNANSFTIVEFQEYSGSPPSNGYNNIIFPVNQPTIGALEADTYTVFMYNYNRDIIKNSALGGLAYIKADLCLNTGCSSSTPVIFDNGYDATSSTAFILSGTSQYASSTQVFGRSSFTLYSPLERLGTTTTVSERYKITPYYTTTGFNLIKANPVVFLVDWYTKEMIDNGIPGQNNQQCAFPVLDKSLICEGIGTPGIDYNLWQAIGCGAKYAIVVSADFLFNPGCDSINSLSNNYEKFKRSFPFNTFYDLTDSITLAIDKANTATTTQGIAIPFIRKTATSTEYYALPVVASSSFSNLIGSKNYNIFYNTLGYVWWLIVATIIYFTVRKI